MNEALKSALKAKGFGSTSLAAALRDQFRPISSQAVAQWQKVPAEWLAAVEHVTGIPACELRPDLYPMAVRQTAAEQECGDAA